MTRVVLPIASSLTLEGTALYEAIAAIFIAQIYNVYLDAAQIVIVRYEVRTSLSSLWYSGDKLWRKDL